RFLKHVERCAVLLHLVDVSEEATVSPMEALQVIEHELAAYSPELAQRPRLLVATKCESPVAEAHARELEAESGRRVFPTSTRPGRGVKELLAETLPRVRARGTHATT